MEVINENKMMKNVVRIAKGSATALIITLVLLLIFAMLLTFTSIQENTIKPVIIIIKLPIKIEFIFIDCTPNKI